LQNNTNTESLPKVIVTLSTDKRVTFKARESCCLYMPTELVYVLGFEGLTYSLEPGYEMLCLEKNVTTKANREIDVDFMVPQNLLMYTDCVVPSLIGNVYGQYLTNIAINRYNNKSPYVVYEPTNLEYHPLQICDLGNVTFRLLKTDGTFPRFRNPQNIKMFITLLLRKKK